LEATVKNQIQVVRLLTLSVFGFAVSVAGDEASSLDLLADPNQFSSIFSEQGWGFPYLTITERPFCGPAKNPWWTDFSAMPKELADAFANSSATSAGFKVLQVTLVLNVETGNIAVETDSTNSVLLSSQPTGYDAAAKYTALLYAWNPFVCSGDIDSCAKQLQPQRLVLHVFLADINDYENCLLAEQEAAVKAASALRTAENLTEGDSGGGAEALAVYEVDFCGGIPVTAITAVSNSDIRLQWVSQTNDTYAVQYANNMEWFNTWHLIADNITNPPSNAVWDDTGILSTNVTKRFYRVVRKDANYGLPCVTVLSPTNAATMSGNATVQVYATDDSRISTITLVVDGKDFFTIRDGPMNFLLPTAFFSNGVHTISARATDNAGMPNLGGDANSPVEVNVSTSETVQVSFQNDITLDWFEGFQSALPIQAYLTVSNADWTVTIKSESGTTVKTLTGSTSNGRINVTWDGTDSGSNPVPYDATYFISITATSSGGGFSVLSTFGPATFASYREQGFFTAQTILVRQRFIRPDVQAAAIGRLGNIKNQIAAADANADVWLGAVIEMVQNSDWTDLHNYLVDPVPRDITQFYYYGHAGPLTLGFRETTPNGGLDATIMGQDLGNEFSYDAVHNVIRAKFRTPYKFVWLDGCESAQGTWPDAFGIIRDRRDYSVVGRKNRAFMGWKDLIIADWLLDIDMGQFVEAFWENWTIDVTTTLGDAISSAHDQVPGAPINKLEVFGYLSLTWED
jgi:Bacterial Ig domain/FlgD Ig-like domain